LYGDRHLLSNREEIMNEPKFDCIVIGYNEPPFEIYEKTVRTYGEDSEAYRDLMFSFVRVGDRPMSYVDLMNHVYELAHPGVGERDQFKSGEAPNLAAVYLTHFLRRRGHKVEFINLYQYEKERLVEYLASDPLCVAITTTFYVLNFPVIEIIGFIRQHNPRTKIIVGGPLIANHARTGVRVAAPALVAIGDQASGGSMVSPLEAALLDIGADIYVIESQGELTLSRIIDNLKTGGQFGQVPNVAYFQSGRLTLSRAIPENNSLDEEAIDWTTVMDNELGPTIQTRTARSCAFSCSFCNYPARAGRLSLASLATIERELDSIYNLRGASTVVFIDDTFNVPLERFKEICRLMIRKQYGFQWFSYFRCSNSDPEAIKLMAQSGCAGVFLGIESGSPTILANMNKAATADKYRRGIHQLRDAGILTFASFIIGFPGETSTTVQETSSFIEETQPDYYRAQLWYCEPGTPIDRQREKYGIDGEGFVWDHATMDSTGAMNHIEKMFLTIRRSIWLPQWSFDFWIIPYLLGKGITLEQFRQFTRVAQRLLTTEIAAISADERMSHRDAGLAELVEQAATWRVRQTASVIKGTHVD
jgi:radical SAM PhpK family P-methyltransferase